MDQKPHLVITISRELGSGGSYIGQQVAKAMNMYYADHEIITKTAEQLSVVEDDIVAQDEKIESFWKSFWLYSGTAPDAYIPAPRKFPPTSYDVFNAESLVIQHIAKEKSSVIIGRGGFYVLRDYPNLLSIFLHGDPDFRAHRLVDKYNLTEDEAKKMVEQNDKERTHYISTFTGKKWNDSKQFHLVINTSKIGIDKTVELILSYLKLL